MNTEQYRTNPLLDKLYMPGETFKMPSQGLFYTNEEISDDVVDGEVHIKPMTAYDEILLRTPDLLFSGKAIEEVFKRCIPQVYKPMELLSKDVDFLLICLRKITYGDLIEIAYKHDCKDAKNHTYQIDINSFLKNTKYIDPTSFKDKFKITLPNGQVVMIQPPKFKDSISIFQRLSINKSEDMTPEKTYNSLIDNVLSIIKSVDNVEDEGLIREWLAELRANWLNNIANEVVTFGEFGIDFDFHAKCKDCNADIKISVPVNPISFFSVP